MLIENMEPRARSIGSIYLMPGINHVDDKKWDHVMKSGFEKPVKGLINDRILTVTDNREKLTIEMVKKTYDPILLEEWAADPKNKGPLRGAIRKQIKDLDLDIL